MNCFADKGTYCAALEKMECDGCVFFKTKKQVSKERADAKAWNDSRGIPTGYKYVEAANKKAKALF
jgi:hypothetical protein